MSYRPSLLHRRFRPSGFTLVELVIVMAITSLLATIAFIGQHRLQIQARFDSSIDKIVQGAADARSTASSNVNSTGGGNDTTGVIAGTSFELDNHHVNALNEPLAEMSMVYGHQDASGQLIMASLSEVPIAGIGVCPAAQHPDDPNECLEQYFATDDTVRSSDVGKTFIYVAYVNTAHGLQSCFHAGLGSVTIPVACSTTPTVPQQFHLKDLDGLTATMEFDPVSGFLRRIN